MTYLLLPVTRKYWFNISSISFLGNTHVLLYITSLYIRLWHTLLCYSSWQGTRYWNDMNATFVGMFFYIYISIYVKSCEQGTFWNSFRFGLVILLYLIHTLLIKASTLYNTECFTFILIRPYGNLKKLLTCELLEFTCHKYTIGTINTLLQHTVRLHENWEVTYSFSYLYEECNTVAHIQSRFMK